MRFQGSNLSGVKKILGMHSYPVPMLLGGSWYEVYWWMCAQVCPDTAAIKKNEPKENPEKCKGGSGGK